MGMRGQKNGAGGGVPDLSRIPMRDIPPDMKAAALEEGEVRAGLRCFGCRRRVESGFKVHAILVAFVGGQGAIEHVTHTVCTDPECDAFLTLLRADESVAVERVAHRFLDDEATRAALGLPPRDPDLSPEPSAPDPEPVAA
jgi:hypothetical protein